MSKAGRPAIVWLRQDLRLADNPALQAACRRGGPVVPVFIWAPEEEGAWPPGARVALVAAPIADPAGRGVSDGRRELVIRRGASLAQLLRVAKETGARAVFWNRRYEPAVIARDRKVEEALRAAGLQSRELQRRAAARALGIQNKSRPALPGLHAVLENLPGLCRTGRAAARAAQSLHPPPKRPASLPLAALELEPKINWTAGLRAAWQPGSAGAHAELQRFLRDGLLTYAEGRNRPDLRRHLAALAAPALRRDQPAPGLARRASASPSRSSIPAATWRHWQFLTELGWREFAHHLLYHFPHTPEQPLRPEFARFPWRENPAWLRAWQRGRTGYPLVDAGMRELWTTGWMHNRVRMVVASFLVKNLLIPWQEGARWFWDTLVDADLANNTLGWQWTAGCGADAAPLLPHLQPGQPGREVRPRGQPTSAAGCRNWRACRPRGSTSPGKRPPPRSRPPGSSWATPIPAPSSASLSPARWPWRHIRKSKALEPGWPLTGGRLRHMTPARNYEHSQYSERKPAPSRAWLTIVLAGRAQHLHLAAVVTNR